MNMIEKNFEKIIGYESIKNKLYRLASVLNDIEKYNALGVKQPKAILLFGDPGVGKTLFAKCFISACNRNSFIIRKDMHRESFIEYINQTFEQAIMQSPSIILIDDLCKFANNDETHKNADEYITIQSCIDKIKDKPVFVIATANDLHNIPNSLLRTGRLGDKIEVFNPVEEDAEKILQFYLENKCISKDIDIKEIVRILDGRSCAELEDVINEAGILAGYENSSEIMEKHIKTAMLQVLFRATESQTKRDKEIIKKIAYHEAGHALVSELLNPNSVNIMTIKKYESDIGGLMSASISKTYWSDMEEMKKRVKVLLGGRAAVDIIYGQTDVGAARDMNRAYNITNRFFEEYGYCGIGNFDHSFLSGSRSREKIEQKCSTLMEVLYEDTKILLAQNKKLLNAFVDALMQKETLFSKEIQEIKSKCYRGGFSEK